MEKLRSKSAEEDFSYYDGNFEPLDMDRTGQLAMECWNLRKTILDTNSQTLKQKQELKSNKHLIQNLQKLVHGLQSDNLNKSKELVSVKTKYLDLEKKLHDQVLTTNCMNSSAIRSKRNTQYLQQKIAEAQNEIKAAAIKQ
jgi:predicted RNA-binding protein with EMAP domain